MRTRKEKFLRALSIVKRCEERKIALSEIASEDGFSAVAYTDILKSVGLFERYKAHKASLKKAKHEANRELLKTWINDKIESVKSAPLRKPEPKAYAVARSILDECIRTDTKLSTLAKQHGCTPRNYIVKLDAAGLYDEYRAAFGLSDRTSQATFDRAREILDQCKSQNLSYQQLAVSHGKLADVYYRLMLRGRTVDEYRQWRKELKLKKLKTML